VSQDLSLPGTISSAGPQDSVSSFGKCHHKSLDYPSASQSASLLDSTETSVISAFKGGLSSVTFTVVSSFKISKGVIGLADNSYR